MAERRMFTMAIIDSDAFLDMPLSTQALYFHLNMRADDDGFVNNPKKIQRMIGASDDDLRVLIAKRFILAFENGVIVIKHWRMHNLLRKDRYNPTQYQEEFQRLGIKENGAYTDDGNQTATTWQPLGNQMATQDSIGKDSIGKVSIVEDSIGEVSIEKKENTLGKPKVQKKPVSFDFENLLSEYSWTDELKEAVRSWIDFKREQHRFTYKPTSLKTLLKQIDRAMLEHGSPLVEDAIENAIANGYQGIGLDRIKSKPTNNNKPKEEFETKWRNIADAVRRNHENNDVD